MATRPPGLMHRLKQCSGWFNYLLLGMLTALAVLLTGIANPLTAQTTAKTSIPLVAQSRTVDPFQLVQLGRDRYQSGQYAAAIAVWQQAITAFTSADDRLNQAMTLSNLALAYQQLGQWPAANQAMARSLQVLEHPDLGDSRDRQRVTAQALTNQGSLLLTQGQTEIALTRWQQATQLYQQLGDEDAATRSLINQSLALRSLGLYQRASQLLEKLNQDLQVAPSNVLKMESLLILGDLQRGMGNLNASQLSLNQALAISRDLKGVDSTTVLLSLGNTALLQQQPQTAKGYYQQVTALAPQSTVALQARLNQLRLALEADQTTEAQTLIAQIETQITDLPASRTTVYAQVNYAQARLKRFKDPSPDEIRHTATILARAVQQARELSDRRAESYALGYLGHLYEQARQFSEAQKLTEEALSLAQLSNAPEIAYQWQWQLGRVLKAQGERNRRTRDLYPQAIAAYDEAIKTLKTLREDLVAINQDVQFSFREQVEPVYRELVSLLLQETSTPDIAQENLQKARQVIESLQLAELDNFFREACLNATAQQVDQIDAEAAVLYPIILPDRLEVILSQANQPLRHYTSRIDQKELETLIRKMQRSLRRSSLAIERTQVAKQLYSLLFRPELDAELSRQAVKRLAFVLDGALKNVPMAALYDGNQYLIEKYAIALTPGLQLLESKTLNPQQLNVLVGGITEENQGFASLPGVAREVKQIQSEIPAQVLLNQDFTSTAIQKQITAAPFPIVHLATHGQFSSDAENTFVLVWDRKLTVKELGDLLRARSERERVPVELLVLSACQTADGDNRAALGLAGVAVRSGARSTLATLWPVDDQSTSALMVKFYQELSRGSLTKAEALRQAQLSLLKQPDFKHPFYWAPFVLVGNWL